MTHGTLRRAQALQLLGMLWRLGNEQNADPAIKAEAIRETQMAAKAALDELPAVDRDQVLALTADWIGGTWLHA